MEVVVLCTSKNCMYMQWSPGDKFFARVRKKKDKSKDFTRYIET